MADTAQITARVLLTATLLAALASSAHGQSGFHWLPSAAMPEGYSGVLRSANGFAISDDGSVVGGVTARHSSDFAYTSFATVWQRGADGSYSPNLLPRVPGLPDPPFRAYPRAVSEVASNGSQFATDRGLWSTGAGYQYGSRVDLLTGWDGGRWHRSNGHSFMSADASVVVEGYGPSGGRYRTILASDTREETPLPIGFTTWGDGTDATISRDGRVISGTGSTDEFSGYDEYTWRWREGLGTEALPLNAGGDVVNILADGSVLFAPRVLGSTMHQWLPDGSVVNLGMPSFAFSSSDGTIFADRSSIWTASTGTLTLDSFLGPGILPTGYEFEVQGISASGSHLLVTATRSDGTVSGTYNLSGVISIPAPAGFVPLVSLGLLSIRRHRSQVL